MAGQQRTNTERIENLASQAANLSARLDVHDTRLDGITNLLKAGSEAAASHHTKITVIEERLLLVDPKGVVEKIAALEKDLALLKKDYDSLKSWKDDQKKEKEEVTRRRWAFGPNVAAALISGLVAFAVLGFNYWLNKPK